MDQILEELFLAPAANYTVLQIKPITTANYGGSIVGKSHLHVLTTSTLSRRLHARPDPSIGSVGGRGQQYQLVLEL